MKKVEPITKVSKSQNDKNNSFQENKKEKTQEDSFADILKVEQEKLVPKQSSLDDIIKANTRPKQNIFIPEDKGR